MDTAATEPAPTPTAACATVDPTSRIPLRTVSMAARKRGGALRGGESACPRDEPRGTGRVANLARAGIRASRQIFRETASFFGAHARGGPGGGRARSLPSPRPGGFPRCPRGRPARTRSVAWGARSSSRRSSSRSSSRSRRVARGAPRHRRRAVRPPVQPHLPHAVRPHHGGAHARRALREGRGRATARSIHALRARRPGRRGSPDAAATDRAASTSTNVAASSPGERRRRDPPTPSKRSKRSKRPRRRRGSAGEARPRRRPRGENQSLPNNPPTE